MPSLSASAVSRPESMTRVAPAAATAPTPPLPNPTGRSTVMLAGLPGIGSGPDAILRQFQGGREVPMQRILVP